MMTAKLIAPGLMAAAMLVGCAANKKCEDCTMSAGHAGYKDAAGDEAAKEVAITREQVPAPVLAGFTKAFPGVTIEEIKKETYADGTIHYEFEFKDKAGKEQEVELNDEGEVLEDHH